MRKHFRSGLRGEDMRKINGQLRLTRLAMWAEAVATAFWPAFALLCFILAFGVLGGFAALGPTGHRVLLGIAVLAFGASLVWGGMRLDRPDRDAVADRLDGTDRRRPLATLRDQLAVGRGTDESETVWLAHRDRARSALSDLRAQKPDLRLSGQDKWAIRLLAPALLIAGLIAAGSSLPSRLAAVGNPAPLTGGAGATYDRDPAAEAWAVPPAYTGLSTVYLAQKGDTGTIPLPQGSEVTIRVTDASELPKLFGSVMAGIEAFTSLGGGLAEVRGVVTGSGTLAVVIGEDQLAAWDVEMIADAPPEIELDGHPSVSLTRSLEIGFSARDDYGVTAAWAEMAPAGHDPDNARGLPLEVISLGLPLPISGDTREVEEVAINDYTAHPWAGAEVVLEVYAEDGAEQVGQIEPITITLPARNFTNPIARALVEQRLALALDYGEAYRVLDVLQAVTRRPHELFENPGPYLGVRTAIRRLATGIGTETIPDEAPEVIELLWLAALSLEDGQLSDALERLRQAQERLRQALQNGTEEDIRQAMQELRAAMNEYLEQLAQQQQNGQPQQQGQMDPNQMLSQQDLQEMLDRMQEQAESGARDEARRMLNELSQLLENMQAAQQGQQGQNPNQQAMQELQEMIQRQRDLSDRTFDEQRMRRREQQLGQQQGQGRQQGQQGREQPGFGDGQGRGDEHGQQGQQQGQGRGEGQSPGQQQQPGEGGLAAEQEALRRELEALARGLGSDEAARALEDAARAMGEARNDLQQGEAGEAVRDQMEALDALNEGADALAQQMQNGQGDTAAEGNRRGQERGRDTAESDPFDRPTSSYGALDGRSTKVPDRALIDRARELMEELRRRSADPARPQLELDYLDRLMERF